MSFLENPKMDSNHTTDLSLGASIRQVALYSLHLTSAQQKHLSPNLFNGKAYRYSAVDRRTALLIDLAQVRTDNHVAPCAFFSLFYQSRQAKMLIYV